MPQIRSPPLFEKLRDHSSDDPAFFFEHLCRAVFQADISGRIVTARWDGIRAACDGFDPATIASLQPADTARLEADPRVIRDSVKIQAVAIAFLSAPASLLVSGLVAAYYVFEQTPARDPAAIDQQP